jgi:glycosyltransferase involved in cell wall biosynthesis
MVNYLFIDEPISGDRRVTRTLDSLGEAQIINIVSEPGNARLHALWILFMGFCKGWKQRKAILELPGMRIRYHPFAGMWSAWHLTGKALASARNILSYSEHSNCSKFYANDLYCGIAAWRVAPEGALMVYDSHELQIHRNRRAGWIRVLVEAGLERIVLDKASEVHVVNYNFRDLLLQIHGTLPNVIVQYNDFYEHYPIIPPSPAGGITLVYIGKGLRGRLLEKLDKPVSELGVSVHVFSLGALLPKELNGAHWHFGSDSYESELLSLVRSQRCLMWCCNETFCLSYIHGLSNKFFQALAVGSPIIAMRGTYQALLVEEYGLGAVYFGNDDLDRILVLADGPEFAVWCANIEKFRSKVRSREIVI